MSQDEIYRRQRREYLLARQEARRRAWSFLIGLGVLFTAFIIFFILKHESIQRSFMYPYYHRELVQEYSQKNHVDEYLVAGLIMSESKFQQQAKSSRGAVGMMQLMPDTARWIAQELNDEAYTDDNLSDPERNIRYGAWYIGELKREFENNDILALAAYNAGRGNVREWMLTRGWGYDFNRVEDIPFLETRNYVKDVLYNQKKYRQLYDNQK